MEEYEDLGIRSDVPLIQRFDFIGQLLLKILDLKVIEYISILLLLLIIGSRLFTISVILQYSRKVLAPIVAGLAGAILPFAINYTVTGEFEFAEIGNAISSVIAGLGILLTTVVTTHIQKTVEGEEDG